jgi:hypothetical protein
LERFSICRSATKVRRTASDGARTLCVALKVTPFLGKAKTGRLGGWASHACGRRQTQASAMRAAKPPGDAPGSARHHRVTARFFRPVLHLRPVSAGTDARFEVRFDESNAIRALS